MKILFLSRTFNVVGGAERQLAILAPGLQRSGHNVKIALFYKGGFLEDELEAKGIPIIHLNKKDRWDFIVFIINLIKVLRKEKPDVIYGWMIIPNILIALVKPFIPKTLMVWGVRTSYLDWKNYDWPPRLAALLEAVLSHMADLIICNSWSGMSDAQKRGLPVDKMVVIPNGIDTSYFYPDRTAGLLIKRSLNISDDIRLLGIVARLDRIKDHAIFLRAAAVVAQDTKDVRFICVGDGPASYKAELVALAEELGLHERLIWVGEKKEMPAVYNSIDLLVSSSYGEGFPNNIAEAMACGVPCVVTNAGDSGQIVENTGIVVPPKDSMALSQGIRAMLLRLEKEGATLTKATRERIKQIYSLDTMISRTSEVLSNFYKACCE